MNRPIEYELQPAYLAQLAGYAVGERTLGAMLQVPTQRERAQLLRAALLEILEAPNHGPEFSRGLAASLIETIEAGLLARLNGGHA